MTILINLLPDVSQLQEMQLRSNSLSTIYHLSYSIDVSKFLILPISDGPVMFTSLRRKLLGKRRLGGSEGILVFAIVADGRTLLAFKRAEYASIF